MDALASARADGVGEQGYLAGGSSDLFERAHAIGVEHERARVARELHDRVGQAVMYLRYELERLASLNHGRAVQRDLVSLRNDLRILADELRTTLVDLRGDGRDQEDIDSSLRALASRVNQRGTIAVTVHAQATTRLPADQEREFLWVAREAVLNAEQHSGGQKVIVRWRLDSSSADLTVTDDGIGMHEEDHINTYGLRGLRERANAIGATLEIQSTPGSGTLVRMSRKTAPRMHDRILIDSP